MSAKPHRDSILALTQEIAEAHKNQTSFPISLITDLLPLQTDQAVEVGARGTFTFNQDEFINEADSELWIEFYDPVMEEFSTTLPAIWKGHLKNENSVLTIIFDEPLELEIPRITSLGIDRSAYQLLESIQVSSVASISKLKDANDEEKEIWIQADIEDNLESGIELFPLHKVGDSTETFGERMMNPIIALTKDENSSSCGPDANDPEWYVYKRSQLCITHHGIMYGSNGYTKEYGPSTKADCDNWINNNCDDTYLC